MPRNLRQESDNSLCFCEYYNRNNERTHILFCCCNCEAFDETCTYILCQGNRNESNEGKGLIKRFDETLDDILDRIRIPSPNGAVKINTDLLISLITIFFYISIGTINFVCSLVTLIGIPMLLYVRYFQLRFNKSKSRNQIAYYMTLVSLITVYIIYNMYLKYEILEDYLAHNCLFLFVILFHIYLHYSNPGYLVSKNIQEESSSSRFCSKCQINKREKISHCPICEKCIFARDHHCFWIDNCVGYLNHKIFFIYLVLLSSLFFYSELIIFRHFSNLKTESNSIISDYYENFSRSLMCLLFLQLISLSLYSFLLLIQQILLIGIGYTQYEMFKYSQTHKNFSLLLFLFGNLSVRMFLKNMLKFLFQFRNKKNLLRLFSINEKLSSNV